MGASTRRFRASVGAVAIAVTIAACSSSNSWPTVTTSVPPPADTATATAATPSAPPASAVPSPVASGGDAAALVWLVPGSSPTHMASLLVVGDAQGHEIRRVTLPHEPYRLYATSGKDAVVIRGTDSWMEANIADGKVATLDFGIIDPTAVKIAGEGGRWWLLVSGSGTPAWLLDLETAKLHALKDLGVTVLAAPLFPSTGSTLFAYTPDTELITPGTSPTMRQVGFGAAHWFTFSPDGKGVVFSAKSGTTWKLEAENVDGSGSQVVLESQAPLLGEYTTDTSHLLIMDGTGVSLYDTGTGKAVQVSTAVAIDSVSSILWSVDRSHALVSYLDKQNTTQWLWVDTQAATAKSLPALAGHFSALRNFLSGAANGSGYQLMAMIEGTTPADFQAVDMATGTVRALDGMDARAVYFDGSAHVSGRWVLAETFLASGGAAAQEWLVDCSTGTAVYIEQDEVVQASISPDATHVVGTAWDGKATSKLALFDLSTGVKTALGSGFDAIWLAR